MLKKEEEVFAGNWTERLNKSKEGKNKILEEGEEWFKKYQLKIDQELGKGFRPLLALKKGIYCNSFQGCC